MACQSQGIQQLLIAEKKAAEKVGEARKREAIRIKQARDETQADVEKYRNERERAKEFESKHLGCRKDVAAKFDEDTQAYMEEMQQDLFANKEKVIDELISSVIDIVPEVHRNYFVVNPRK